MSRPDRGFGLLELMLSMTLFALVAGISLLLLQRGGSLWRGITETQDANHELGKAVRALKRDLCLASSTQIAVQQMPASLGAGASDGAVIWFLSAIDPATGEFVRTPDGAPFWQKNIVYYLVVPSNHDAVFGQSCNGGAGPGGFDDRCPHKVLVRKVIDTGVATTPASDPATDMETLLANPSAYLTRPSGYDTSTMLTEPGLSSVRVVASRLLYWNATLGKDPSWSEEIELDLRAVAIREARRATAVGTASLATGPYTSQVLVGVFPMN